MLDDHWNLSYHINFHMPDVIKHVPLIFFNCVDRKNADVKGDYNQGIQPVPVVSSQVKRGLGKTDVLN